MGDSHPTALAAATEVIGRCAGRRSRGCPRGVLAASTRYAVLVGLDAQRVDVELPLESWPRGRTRSASRRLWWRTMTTTSSGLWCATMSPIESSGCCGVTSPSADAPASRRRLERRVEHALRVVVCDRPRVLLPVWMVGHAAPRPAVTSISQSSMTALIDADVGCSGTATWKRGVRAVAQVRRGPAHRCATARAWSRRRCVAMAGPPIGSLCGAVKHKPNAVSLTGQRVPRPGRQVASPLRPHGSRRSRRRGIAPCH